MSAWVQIAAALLSGPLIYECTKWIWRSLLRPSPQDSRIDDLENLVDALRRALDKTRLREDAMGQVLGVLIFALKTIEPLSPAIRDAIDRAISILESAQNRLRGINGDAE